MPSFEKAQEERTRDFEGAVRREMAKEQASFFTVIVTGQIEFADVRRALHFTHATLTIPAFTTLPSPAPLPLFVRTDRAPSLTRFQIFP